MDIFIDNVNIESTYGIKVLDYTGALSFASERENTRIWADKSGVDPNLVNRRFDAKEFVFECVVKASNEVTAYNVVKTLVDYMFLKGVFVMSLRDSILNIRECFPCTRSNTIVGNINVRKQNSLYAFKLGFRDINPVAVKYKTAIVANEASIEYTKGKNAVLYWGDGSRQFVTNSGTYTKSDYAAETGNVDIIVDVDSNLPDLTALVADFTGTPLSGTINFNVQFTDASTGSPVAWSWDFGDGEISSEQNPLHTYSVAGVYTVTLQVFNAVAGSDTLVRTDYITANITDFDSNIDGETITAIVSEPFTFTLAADTTRADENTATAVYLRLTLNGVYEDISIPAGTNIKTISIVRNFPDVAGDSYFKVAMRIQSNSDQIPMNLFFEKGTLILENAGAKRFRMYAAFVSATDQPWFMRLKGNAISVADINAVLEDMADTVDRATNLPFRIFDISLGTNAIPDSAAALAVKTEMNTMYVYYYYYDNE